MSYANPVISGFYPDPSVCRVGDDYYLVTSSFNYFPGVPLFHSRDLVHWQQIGHCLTRRSQLNLAGATPGGGIYAPTLRYHKGRFYMITTNVSHGSHFYVSTDDIHGEWSDPVWIDGTGNGNGHDPDLFFDEDGCVYYSRFSWDHGIMQWELDIETGKLLSMGKSIWQGFDDPLCEAPHLYYINGAYYLMVAEGGTHRGHMIVVARSERPEGPFTGAPHNPVLTHRNRVTQYIQATGHGDFVQARDGSWWIVFLAIRQHGGWHHLGRETFLAPVRWTDDGWPVIYDGQVITDKMLAETLPAVPWPASALRDDFAHDVLDLQWNFLREPSPELCSLIDRPGFLTLRGTQHTLSEMGTKAFLGRRQQHFTCNASVSLSFQPIHDGEEAGITVFMDEDHHYDLALCQYEGRRQVIVRKTIGDFAALVFAAVVTASSLILSIKATASHYAFSYQLGEEEECEVAHGRTRYLSSEVAGGFTGTYIGLYATGNGRACETPAYVDWFEYTGK